MEQKEEQNIKKIHWPRWITLAVILVLVLCYFFIPQVNGFVNGIISVFASSVSGGDTKAVESFIGSYGSMAAGISFFLMIFTAVLAPLPSFLITFSNAALFGAFWGGVLSWTSAMVGAALCFWLAKWLGRSFVVKLTTKTGLESIDGFFGKYGKHAILICRLLPFVSFDIVSYAAGLTSMSFGPFMLATGIGQLPATIVYSYLGSHLTGSTRTIVTALLVIFALFTLTFLFRKIYMNRNREKLEAIAKKQAEAKGNNVNHSIEK